jgi:transcriptional regulator with XRE-family HTH domain
VNKKDKKMKNEFIVELHELGLDLGPEGPPEPGEIIKSIRGARRLTQKEFADAIGVSSIAVQNWEGGKTGITQRSIRLIAEKLKVDPLLFGKRNKAISDEIRASWGMPEARIDDFAPSLARSFPLIKPEAKGIFFARGQIGDIRFGEAEITFPHWFDAELAFSAGFDHSFVATQADSGMGLAVGLVKPDFKTPVLGNLFLVQDRIAEQLYLARFSETVGPVRALVNGGLQEFVDLNEFEKRFEILGLAQIVPFKQDQKTYQGLGVAPSRGPI